MSKNTQRFICFIFAVLLLLSIILMFSGCNRQVFDTTYDFNYAIIRLPNGEIIDGKVDSWRDFEDGDQLQIKISGITYLIHSSNCVLISDGSTTKQPLPEPQVL